MIEIHNQMLSNFAKRKRIGKNDMNNIKKNKLSQTLAMCFQIIKTQPTWLFANNMSKINCCNIIKKLQFIRCLVLQII